MAQLQVKKGSSISKNLFHKKMDRNIYVFTECIYVIESKSPLKMKAWKFLATYISICPITETPTLREGCGKEKNNVKARVP